MMSDSNRMTPERPDTPRRIVSLDVFRGLTIAGMILVNNPGDWSHIYPPLEHAEWHGWTPTDLIFPFFLFIVGVAMPFSFSSRRSKGASSATLIQHIVYRSAILFLLGMILTGIPNFNYSHKLILDVLQRIGVIYLLSAPIVLFAHPKTQWGVAIGCLVLYWALMALVPVPGYGAGVLAQEGNLWQYVDKVVTEGWHFHGEGILSIIPSISTVLFGSLTGYLLQSNQETDEKLVKIFVFGNIGLVLGLILNGWFPINKLLWSSSYVLFTAGFALNLFGVCYWLVDVKGFKRWSQPFIVFGMNAIAVFFLSSFAVRLLGLITVSHTEGPGGPVPMSIKAFVYSHLFAGGGSTENTSLAFAVVYVFVWWGIMTLFHKKKTFIKI
jgi:predicted acyltransferase